MVDPVAFSGVRRRPVWRAVAVFALAGIVVLCAVTLAVDVASRRAGTDAAIRDARRDTSVLGRAVIAPALTDGLVRADPGAVGSLDAVVRRRVLDADLVRVKVWRPDGTVVYSDAAALIGSTYTLGADEQAAFRTGVAAADVSDLRRPENRFERPFHKLLEVYQPVVTPGGDTLLFEAYFRYEAVTAAGRRAWMDFAPLMVIALVALEALQIPLAWSMARRLRTGQDYQERLMRRAVEASDAERRRIAGDLHDGVVQDLASVSYSLAAVEPRLDGNDRQTLRDAAVGTRRSIRALRSLLVEIYPPSLSESGLSAAVADLIAPLPARGIHASADVPATLALQPAAEALLYRAAQEGVRNVVAHAKARSIAVSVTSDGGTASLDVVDDGIGFDPQADTERPADGHVGLRLLRDLITDAGGRLDITSRIGGGTRLHVEVPDR